MRTADVELFSCRLPVSHRVVAVVVFVGVDRLAAVRAELAGGHARSPPCIPKRRVILPESGALEEIRILEISS
jgi:hypothetical protein